MYKDYFGLKANPFNVNPDPRYLFLTPQTREALACLTYGIQSRKGFILLTGEVGTGKTTLINKLMNWLHQKHVATSFIFNSLLDSNQFMELMLADFGIDCEPSKSKMLQRLNQFLLEKYRNGETAVLIVDEAQHLSYAVLEEIRLLTNLETPTDKLLQIVLSGQPELDRTLKQPEVRQVLQRISLRCKTAPLSAADTANYVRHRLRLAGAENMQIFSVTALEAIHTYACGIPRVVNLLCEHGLINTMVEEQKQVSAGCIEAIAHEFDLDKVAPIDITRSMPYEDDPLRELSRTGQRITDKRNRTGGAA